MKWTTFKKYIFFLFFLSVLAGTYVFVRHSLAEVVIYSDPETIVTKGLDEVGGTETGGPATTPTTCGEPKIDFYGYSESTSNVWLEAFVTCVQKATSTISKGVQAGEGNLDICKSNNIDTSIRCEVKNLSANTSYQFVLHVDYVDLKGNKGSKELSILVTTLKEINEAPSNLKAFANSANTVYINWKDNSTSTDSYKFEIQRMKLTPAAPTSTTSTVEEVYPGKIRVTLRWQNNTTSTPYRDVIEKSTSSYFLNTDLFDYKLSDIPFERKEWDIHNPTPRGTGYVTNTFEDYSVEEATVYYYKVRECSIIDSSAYYTQGGGSTSLMSGSTAKPPYACTWPVEVGEVVTPPYAPIDLRAELNVDDKNNTQTVNLRWTNKSAKATYIKIFRSDLSEDLPGGVLLGAVYASNISSYYSDSSVSPGRTYTYYLKSCVEIGGEEYCSKESGSVNVTTYNQVNVSVVVKNNAKGKVTGDGISCDDGGGDCIGFFPQGSSTVLSAIPAPNSSSTFVGWGEPCSGTGNCVVTSTASVTATFTIPQSGGFREFNKFFASLFSVSSNLANSLSDLFGKAKLFYEEKIVKGFFDNLWQKIAQIFTVSKKYAKNVFTPQVKAENSFDWDSYFVGVATVTTPYYKDTDLEADTVYLYRVRVFYEGSGKRSDWSPFVAVKTLVDGTTPVQNQNAKICIANGVCDKTIPYFVSRSYTSGRNPQIEFSESQCTVNADCGEVGRVGKTIQERQF